MNLFAQPEPRTNRDVCKISRSTATADRTVDAWIMTPPCSPVGRRFSPEDRSNTDRYVEKNRYTQTSRHTHIVSFISARRFGFHQAYVYNTGHMR